MDYRMLHRPYVVCCVHTILAYVDEFRGVLLLKLFINAMNKYATNK